jgi:hypothetical protein
MIWLRLNALSGQMILMVTGIIFLLSCEVPISVDYEVIEPQIVVDGLITNEPGPYEVKLTYSSAYTEGTEGNNPPVSGALVILRDDTGHEEVLFEGRPGIYQTDPVFTGEIGRVYTLLINTAEGKLIESMPEEMLPVPEIDSIYYVFNPKSEIQKQGHEVYVVVDDPADEKNYYRWKWDGFYRFDMVSDMETRVCFKHEFDINRISTITDRDFNGNKIYMPVSFVEHFSNDYYLIHIHQYSLTENAYKFWNALYEQGANVGSIFDPQPARIKGNLFYADDTEAAVHGFFGASAHQLGYQYMNFNAGIRPEYPRSYGFKRCDQHLNSFIYDINDPRWPVGWEGW